jgi:hypothetical protein
VSRLSNFVFPLYYSSSISVSVSDPSGRRILGLPPFIRASDIDVNIPIVSLVASEAQISIWNSSSLDMSRLERRASGHFVARG